MTTAGDAFVAQQLSDGLDVTGTVAMDQLGVPDRAGVTAPPLEIDLSKAEPMNPDVEALEARIRELQAAQLAATPATDPGPAETVESAPAPVLSGSVGSDVRAAFDSLHERLLRLEHLAGL